MLESLVITLREGVEAALIVGIVLACLVKIGRPDLRRVVFWALGAAGVASIAVAVVLARLSWNQDIFEGVLEIVAAFFVVSMVIFMARAARTLKSSIEERIGGFVARGSALGLFVFIFLMVLREGVETVVMLSAVSFNSTELLSAIGTLVGVALAVVFGVMFVKGSVRIDLRKFFRVTTVILWFVAAQLLVSGLHELSENGVLPSSQREMALIGPIIRNDVFFVVAILALAAMMLLFEQRRRADVMLSAAATPAERRKAQWTARRERMWALSVYSSAFVFILLITAQFIYAKSTSSLPPATPVTVVNGQAIVPVAELATDDIHHYEADLN